MQVLSLMGMLTDRSREVDEKYDMWSFGVLLGQMVTRDKLYPYPANSNLVIQHCISTLCDAIVYD